MAGTALASTAPHSKLRATAAAETEEEAADVATNAVEGPSDSRKWGAQRLRPCGLHKRKAAAHVGRGAAQCATSPASRAKVMKRWKLSSAPPPLLLLLLLLVLPLLLPTAPARA